MFELERAYPGDRFAGYEPVEFEEAFSEVAISPHRLTYTERQLLDGGTVVMDDRLPHADTIVRYDGTYYTFVAYSMDSPLCVDNAPELDFCETADSVRFRRFAGKWGSVLVGLLGAVLGGAGLGCAVPASWRGR